MRTIQEIKSDMAAEWMRNEAVQERYGLASGASFGDHFGPASVENMMLYVMAACAWTVERLLGEHRAEVTEQIEAIIPHRPKWYRDKVLHFMEGKELKEDSDEYDTAGMSESEIERARVVKHAVAVESRDASLLTIKVAGESGGKRGCAQRGAGKVAESLHSRDKRRRGKNRTCKHVTRHIQLRGGCVLQRDVTAGGGACRVCDSHNGIYRKFAVQWRIHQHGSR